jgi:hypothetical protein
MRSSIRAILFLIAVSPAAASLSAGCGSSGNTGGSGAGNATGTGGTGVGGSGSGAGSSGSGAGSSGSGAGSSGSGAGSSGSGASSSGTGAAGGSGPCVPVTCQGKTYACGDCLDNDGDGLVDADDPDCLGPCDNTEDSYFGGIPGQNNAPCKMDCYFDQDTGPGNDDCYWDHKCDPHEVAAGYYPEHDLGVQCAYDPNANTPGTSKTCDELYNAQSATCGSYCGPLTPNGCDCFGCCELPAGSAKYVWLGSTLNGVGTCDIASVGDPSKCQPCLPVKGCLNTCEHCELCLGKTTLPPDCFPDGGSTSSSSSTSSGSTTSSSGSTTSSSSTSSGSTGQCSPGVQPCGLPGQSPCGAGTYCITGCCQQIPG